MNKSKKEVIVGIAIIIIVVLLILPKQQTVTHEDMHNMMHSILGEHFQEKHHEQLHTYLNEGGGLSTKMHHEMMHNFMDELLGGHFEEKHHEELHKYLMDQGVCDTNDCPMNMMGSMMAQTETYLPLQTQPVPNAQQMSIVELNDGDTFSLSADIVNKKLGGKQYTMFGYNEQIPGPVLKVEKGSTITVDFTNNIDAETTVHWHGLRHDNKDDGVPDVTQPPVKTGETYTYTVAFPDAGIYWYHPHIREDIQQDLGLAGNMLVMVSPENKPQVNREEILMLDDIFIKNGELVPYGKEDANFALMGRFGNVLLMNGEDNYDLEVEKGEIIRFYITNVANVRPFKLSFSGAKMKLVGSDIGFYEQEQFVKSVIIHPAERYLVDVFFEQEGTYKVQHNNPHKNYDLGTITVSSNQIKDDYAAQFKKLQTYTAIKNDIDSFKQYFDKPIDYTFDLTIDMVGMDESMMEHMEMMKHAAEEENIEWEDPMPMMNQGMTSKTVKWTLQDKETGKKNMDFSIEAEEGDVIKIRLFNDPDSIHPMQHPIHLHGQRFLVLSENGKPNNNLVWKDTVVVPKGSTIDILVDITNPGEWMMHCHIAEHLEAGMMTRLIVKED